jgi:hypothetical protein
VCLYASTSTTLTSLIMGKEKRTLHRVANATTAPSCFVSSNARKWVYRGVIRERYRLIFLRRGSVPKDKTLFSIVFPTSLEVTSLERLVSLGFTLCYCRLPKQTE